MEEQIGSYDEKESSHKSRMSDKRTPGERKPNNFLRFEVLVDPEVKVQIWIFRHGGDYRLKPQGLRHQCPLPSITGMPLRRCVSRLRSCLMVTLIALVASGCSGYSKEQEQEMQRIRDMVTARSGSVNTLDSSGNTPLHLAVLNNYIPLMDWLKEHGADPNARGLHGDTPLHMAVISDHSSDGRVIMRLLKMGANVNVANDYGDTPLHRAAYQGLTEKVRLLLRNKADVSARAQRGETPLLSAARPEGYPDTVLALLEGGAGADVADNFGMTPLHGAAMIGDVEVARVLVETGHAELNSQTMDGSTPLHIAAVFGKAEFIRFLLDKGANPDARDHDNRTASERAWRSPATSYSKDGAVPVDTSEVVNILRTHESVR
jgi:hypothetical protein